MPKRIENQLSELIDSLRKKEQEEKRRYDAAIDIKDMAEASVVILDSRTRILKLRQWSEVLIEVRKDMSESFLSSGEDSHQQPISGFGVRPDSLQISLDTDEADGSLFIEELLTDVMTEQPEPVLTETNSMSDVAPERIRLMGKTIPAKNWDNVLLRLCEVMVLKTPYKTLSLGVHKTLKVGDQPVLWYDERTESGESYRLSNGLSVVKNISREEIISCCERILDMCGYKLEELEIS